MIGNNTNYWIGSEFYDYTLKKSEYKVHETNMTTSEVFKINAFRDKLALNSGKKVVILDQDVLSLPAYELAKKVHKESSSYDSCVKKIINYRKFNPLTSPRGYVFFKVNIKERIARISHRTKFERPTSDFFCNLLTQAAYQSFYESFLEEIDPFYYHIIDTTNKIPDEVFKETLSFIEKLESDYRNPQNIYNLVYPSQNTLIKRVWDIYEQYLLVLNFSKETKYD